VQHRDRVRPKTRRQTPHVWHDQQPAQLRSGHWDRQTQSWWQQFDGHAIVGKLTGDQLVPLNSEMLSFADFRARYHQGEVLSRDTGFDRPYGQTPYAGYDFKGQRPFLYRGKLDPRLRALACVEVVTAGSATVVLPFDVLSRHPATAITIAGTPAIVVFQPGVLSPLDAKQLNESRAVGAAAAFDRRVRGYTLAFRAVSPGAMADLQTHSLWDDTGRAVDGPLRGTQLRRLGDCTGVLVCHRGVPAARANRHEPNVIARARAAPMPSPRRPTFSSSSIAGRSDSSCARKARDRGAGAANPFRWRRGQRSNYGFSVLGMSTRLKAFEDRHLVALAQAGEREAFDELAGRYSVRLRRVLWRITGDLEATDDAVQETLVRAWRNIARFQGRSGFFTWLTRIGINESYRAMRGSNQEPLGLLDDVGRRIPDWRARPEDTVESREFLAAVERALGGLPTDYRAAVLLRDIEGMSTIEAAEALAINERALKSRLHRGRMALRAELDSYFREGYVR